MPAEDAPSAGDVTLATYGAAATRYRDLSTPPGPQLRAYLDRFAELVGPATVLEVGSGPGRDAAYLEGRGLRVLRTDAAPAFVEMMRADGHDARLLDVRLDDLGGPHAGVLADAVLLHLRRAEFVDVLRRVRVAVGAGGVLACTLKEGDGEGWSDARLELPRHFTYWREPAVRQALLATGWTVLSITRVAGRVEPWLYVHARAAPV